MKHKQILDLTEKILELDTHNSTWFCVFIVNFVRISLGNWLLQLHLYLFVFVLLEELALQKQEAEKERMEAVKQQKILREERDRYRDETRESK